MARISRAASGNSRCAARDLRRQRRDEPTAAGPSINY